MICKKCGARLQETDQFCPKCGAKVIKTRRCPDCGEVLRDGVKFCPGCGRTVGSRKSAPAVSDETLDIPIEAIEKNILSETAAEIKAERRTGSSPRKSVSKETAPARRSSSGTVSERRRADGDKTARRTSSKSETVDSTPSRRVDSGRNSSTGAPVKKKQAAVPAPPPRKKKPVYREEVWEDDDWEDEEEWEDDDWDEDDWEDEEGVDAITIMTAVTGCILLIVVAVLGFHFYKQYVPKNYDKAAEEEQKEEDGEEEEQGEEQIEPSEQDGEEDSQEQPAGISGGSSKLTIVSDVNVRDQPSTSGTNVLRVAKEGETYDCNGITEDGEWYEIVLEDGTVGYVFHEYVSIE